MMPIDTCMEWFTTSALRRMLAGAALAMPLAAGAAHWSCLGPKPGHPTPEERAAFVREVSELATKAEKMHGVPAGALAAVAIAESVYGTTRVALQAHNYFAWKFVPSAAEGRQPYVPECALRRRALRFPTGLFPAASLRICWLPCRNWIPSE